MGRPQKPITEVLRDKTFRADRHADRLAAAAAHAPTCPPSRPRGLKGEARKLWDLIVPELAGVVGPRDTSSLVLLCESYGQWRTSAQALEKHKPGDAEHARIARTMRGFFETYEKLAARFGLDPISRERLPVGTDQEVDGLARWEEDRLAKKYGLT